MTLTTSFAQSLAERAEAGDRFFAADSERMARLCMEMADRFARGGRLLAVAATPVARSDARHVAVEFVHPVIVGKRALPAIALTPDDGPAADLLALLAEPDDTVMVFGEGVAPSLAAAEDRGCLTVAFAPAQARYVLDPPSEDPFVRQELIETAYHVLWELVHVFLEHRGVSHDAGAAGFLYPFLGGDPDGPEALVADVARSMRMKGEEVRDLRTGTLQDAAEAMRAAAAELRRRFEAGGRLLALGNGGSATDAMDVVADFRETSHHGWRPRPALDLTQDTAVLTAIANDVGVEQVFARQVIALGRSQDAMLALSTSGGSANVIAALVEGRRRGLQTIALVGYDGGPIAAEDLADHVVVVRSQHIPRIQEAQATAVHLLRELVEQRAP